VDTFDVEKAIETAVRVAGPELGAVRLDSGDLPKLVKQVREQLDALGATKTRITVTNDLDEFTIAALAASPVDSYGVGTSVVTGSGSPASGMVYKLVAHRARGSEGEWIPVAKKSENKASVAGRKHPVRRLDGTGTAVAEVVHIVEKGDIPDDTGRDLLVPLITDGEVHPEHLGIDGTRRAREHRELALSELPDEAFRLGRGDPVLPTLFE
jgi:nicotinate phosphoribosyltransferase